MSKKNPWFGLECQNCEQNWDDEYINAKHYTLNSAHVDRYGQKIWYCGKCNFEIQEKMKADAKKAQTGFVISSK